MAEKIQGLEVDYPHVCLVYIVLGINNQHVKWLHCANKGFLFVCVLIMMHANGMMYIIVGWAQIAAIRSADSVSITFPPRH